MTTHAPIEALVLDLDGVFYVGDTLVAGATDTLAWIREAQIPFRFITNTTTRTPDELVTKLDNLGLKAGPDEIFSALSATHDFLSQRGRPSCYLLVRESVKGLFTEFGENDQDPDFVVIGDIGAAWDYETLNRVFNMIMNGAKLLCMHRNKYWQTEQGLRMDIGAFVAALEYVTGQTAIVIGKPSAAFFQLAIDALGCSAENTAVLGDDIESDIGGGQAAHLQGILVRTGKFREEVMQHSAVKPDYVIDSIADLPALLQRREHR